MNLSLRKINKNRVNNLKKFFENLVHTNQTNQSIQADKNNNNSNEFGHTFEGSKSHETCAQNNDNLVKTQNFFDSFQINEPSSKIDNEEKKFDTREEKENKKKIKNSKKNQFFVTNDKMDQFSVKSLSNCTLISNFLSDQETNDYNKNLSEINNFSSAENKNGKNLKITKVHDDDDPRQNKFSFNLFKLLKLLLTAKCYCVLLTEKQNSNDLKKLIFILYEMKQTALKKLASVDSTEFSDAKLNDFFLADLFNLLCEVHVNLFFLYF